MPHLTLTLASGAPPLTVHRFAVHAALSNLFTASVWAVTPDPSYDLDAVVGKDASFRIEDARGGARVWSGIVRVMELARVGGGKLAEMAIAGASGLSTYRVEIVPRLWLLTQRQNYRIYQHLSIPDIVEKLLAEWSLAPVWRIDRGRYPELEFKVQYRESDYAFVSRLLEEAGITLFWDDTDGDATKLVLGDEPHENPKRSGAPLPYVANPSRADALEHVTRVRLGHEVRPGAHVIRDHDFRRPAYALFGKSEPVAAAASLEQYHYLPGAFSIEPGEGGDTPSADDRGIMRHDEDFGRGRAERGLQADRAGHRAVAFETNVVDLRPGVVFAMDDHVHPELGVGKTLLVTSQSLMGSLQGEWKMSGEAFFTDGPYVPRKKTPKPEVIGVQTATVVGPAGEEIHTDEFGRVRVQFPWDREGTNDEKSSCWIRPNQGWGGAGYGFINLPRIGQEVLVAFVEGDPDQPVLVSRLYNAAQVTADFLPEFKTASSWKSNSSPNADGFNAIRFEDLADSEEVFVQAQKNLRKLVKNDETITVGDDRAKDVGNDETDTTGNDRTEVTRRDRSETTDRNRTYAIDVDRRELIQRDETEITQRDRRRLTARDFDNVVHGSRRALISGGIDQEPPIKKRDATTIGDHLHVKGDRRERVDGTQSLTVGEDRQIVVSGSFALQAGGQIHLEAPATWIGDAPDITLKGAGGFVRIDGSGVTIVGNRVEINVSGSPGKGKGSKPTLPDEAKKAQVGNEEGQ